MHGTDFRREKDWKPFAEAVIDLLEIKIKLVDCFTAILPSSEVSVAESKELNKQ